MLRHGQFLSLKDDDRGRIREVTCAEIVLCSAERVMAVLTDYEDYVKFVPGVRRLKVCARKGNRTLVKSEVGLKVAGVGGFITVANEMIHEDPYVVLLNGDTGALQGFWKVMPLAPERCILVYYTIAEDLANVHSFVRFFIRVFPPAEVAFTVSPAVILVKAMKRRMEKAPAAGSRT